MDFTLWLEVILFIIMMALSGFFSSSETSLFSLTTTQLEQMRRNRDPRVDLIQEMLTQPRRLIMTILIGNELVNVTASAISAAVVIKLLGAESKWINLFIMVPLLLLIGEITPKALAIRHNVAFARFESKPIEIFSQVIKPVRWLARSVSDRIITLLIGKERSRGNIITEDMVRTLAQEAVGEGALDHLEANFINQIFDFGDKTLKDVMTPRSDVFFLPAEMPLEVMIKALCRTRHTKVPVFKGDRDHIAGILHARDLLGIDAKEVSSDPQKLEKILREPYFVPESKPAAQLFYTFRERKLSVALTVDEYGGVTGLVTMEDLVECIFGEIRSASDEIRQFRIKDRGGGRYAVDGRMPVGQFNEEMGADLSEDWGETIGGLLLHHYGELPAEGATIEIGEMRFWVKEVEGNRIKEIECARISRTESPTTPPVGPHNDGNEIPQQTPTRLPEEEPEEG